MGFFENQKERKQLQDKFKSDTSGVAKHSSALSRKQDALIRTYEEALLPKLAKILFVGMILLTVVMAAVDLKNGLAYLSQMGMERVLFNMSKTMLLIWAVCTALITFVCCIGIVQNRHMVRKKAREGCPNAWTKNDNARCARASRRISRPYYTYLLVNWIGTAMLYMIHIHLKA